LFERVRSDPKLVENTLILICSDNGPEKGAGTAGKLKGYKTHLYEGGIRSSLVVWGPGLVDEEATGGRNKESVFSAMDLVPSLIRLVGDSSNSEKFDGEELLKTLLGKVSDSRGAPLFFSRPPDRKNFYGFENLPDLAVREGKWKLLCDYDGDRPELYDLSVDPSEGNNLADKNQELTERLRTSVMAWYAEVLNSER
ncbi:MAG: sulfatase-like hydrolase/transferase, partial [Akkermansiaceae bacterium]